jgi:trimethyllysine dioxygenase
MGDLIARIDSLSSSNGDKTLKEPQESILRTLDIPEFSFKDIFHPTSEPDTGTMLKIRVFEHLLHPSTSGLIKIVVDLPEPDVEVEKNKTGTIVTRVLKELLGSVFHHPIRGSDKTSNVSFHHQEDVQRIAGLPNHDTSQVLLPHVDHAYYIHPIRVQGWYILEGESENTFVSTRAVNETMHKEEPGLVALLESSPMTVGRVAPYYNPPMLQATVDTVITTLPGFPSAIKRVRWHPHLAGSLVIPVEDYTEANKAHRKFQQIMRRETHQLKLQLRPGDLYLWDILRILDGRESGGKVPRTGVGQTVPEQVVEDQHRALHMKVVAKHIEERWLVHLPMAQLCHPAKLLT